MCVHIGRRSGLFVAAWLSIFPLASGCAPGSDVDIDSVRAALVEPDATMVEGFESGSKSAYAAADVVLTSGSWSFDDAVIGALAADVKDGAHAARLRNSGTLTMEFDHAGAGTVTIAHASYGSDGVGTWALYDSQDQGASWTQVAGAVSTSGGALASASFSVNVARNVRFQLRKTDGGSNRIDIDDIAITDDSRGGSGGGSGSGGGGGGTGSGGGSGSGGGGGSGSTGGAGVSVHTTLGLPSPSSTGNWDSYLSVKSQYVVSYDSARETPSWVSWELNSSYLGSVTRSDDFRTDNTLPAGMTQASLADYSGSGYQRGHMCPSADRTATTSANQQTFYLSNMVPQAANSNDGPWGQLEDYERTLATSGNELFIVAGGIYTSSSKTIGSGVTVPDATFKVIVVLSAPGQGPRDVTTSTRVIGVIMPNDNSKISASDSWQSYRVAVRTIEAQTGFDFLSDVAPSVQNVVETRVDNQ